MVKVLVVDDEAAIVRFTQTSLELAGHDVRTAADGAAALDEIRAARPDAVILDVMMPEVDGWAVLEALKADPDEGIRTIPVVLLTALDSRHDEARGGIEGAVRYLTKPISADELLAALDDVLRGPPEPEQRRAAQSAGLASLARIERHAAGGDEPSAPGPRLSRLERPRGVPETMVPRTPGAATAGDLTAKQRELLSALLNAPSVSAAASDLGTSRSNVYASLRRVGRKLGITDVSELLRRLRSGDLASALEP